MIGLLDSGVGGLSVLREIHARLPGVPTLYYADQAHLPYGERPYAELRGYIDAIADHLLAAGCTVIVLACHAASAAALHSLRQRLPHVPIVGIEPAVKPAAERTQTGVIGVVTTRATADGALFRRVTEKYAAHVRVLTCIAPDWVTLVEADAAATPHGHAALRAVIDPLLAANADQIALACTHFPFLTPHLIPLLAGRAALIDPAPGVAAQTARVLPPITGAAGQHRYITSGDRAAFAGMVRRLLADPAIPDSAITGAG